MYLSEKLFWSFTSVCPYNVWHLCVHYSYITILGEKKLSPVYYNFRQGIAEPCNYNFKFGEAELHTQFFEKFTCFTWNFTPKTSKVRSFLIFRPLSFRDVGMPLDSSSTTIKLHFKKKRVKYCAFTLFFRSNHPSSAPPPPCQKAFGTHVLKILTHSLKYSFRVLSRGMQIADHSYSRTLQDLKLVCASAKVYVFAIGHLMPVTFVLSSLI